REKRPALGGAFPITAMSPSNSGVAARYSARRSPRTRRRMGLIPRGRSQPMNRGAIMSTKQTPTTTEPPPAATAAPAAAPPAAPPPAKTPFIPAENAKVDVAGMETTSWFVTAPPAFILDDLKEPGIWRAVQGGASRSGLRKHDRLLIIDWEESWRVEA